MKSQDHSYQSLVEEIKDHDIMQCGMCEQRSVVTYHGNPDGRCPVCDAGIYWQTAPEPKTFNDALAVVEGYKHQSRFRLFLRGMTGASLKTLFEASEWLEKEIKTRK